jgi:hypothetical protein
MTDLQHPYATDKHATYENFEARCPICGYWNIFNRATEFADFGPICFKTVECLNSSCEQQFNINGDIISPSWQEFIMQCYTFKEEKRYMLCIVTLAQAFELFFSHFLYKTLVDEPLKKDPEPVTAENYNALSDALYGRVEKLAYRKLRNVFLNVAIQGMTPMTVGEAMEIIQRIPGMCCDPSDNTLNTYPDVDTGSLLHGVKASNIASLRNRVVHKEGFRPCLDDVESALSDTRMLIFGLASRLGVR